MELPIILLISLFGPFLIWPLEYFLPYPFIIEEIFKFFVVKYFPDANIRKYLFAGLAFSLTETVLYSININLFGTFWLFFVRIILTTLLHSGTFVLIAYTFKRGRTATIIGVTVSILIHFLYNKFIPSFGI